EIFPLTKATPRALAAFERSGKVSLRRTTVFAPAIPRYSGATSMRNFPAGVWTSVCLVWAKAAPERARRRQAQEARRPDTRFISPSQPREGRRTFPDRRGRGSSDGGD